MVSTPMLGIAGARGNGREKVKANMWNGDGVISPKAGKIVAAVRERDGPSLQTSFRRLILPFSKPETEPPSTAKMSDTKSKKGV